MCLEPTCDSVQAEFLSCLALRVYVEILILLAFRVLKKLKTKEGAELTYEMIKAMAELPPYFVNSETKYRIKCESLNITVLTCG